MKREDVHSVKIYFVKPIDLINVFINTMIEMEYETYIISEYDQVKLLKILPEDLMNIVFLCVPNKHDAPKWLEYVGMLKGVKNSTIQIGAFAYTSMEEKIKRLFLYNLVSVTPFAELRTNPIEVFKKIFQAFDAKGSRKYIRVAPRDLSEAFIMVQNRNDPVKGKIIDLSASAFACEIDQHYHEHFVEPGSFFQNILLHIKGVRIRTAAKLLGFSEANKNVFIFRYYGTELKDGKTTYSENVPQEVKQKIHKYITSCLREDLKENLAKVNPEEVKLEEVRLEEVRLEDKKEKPKTQKADEAAAVEELEEEGEQANSDTEKIETEEELPATEGKVTDDEES